jgi:23S rRNA (uracil1939-C5)-methyltransferase
MTPRRFDNSRAIDLVHGHEEVVATFPDVGLSESDNVLILIDEFRFSVEARTFFQVNRFLLRAVLDAVVATEQGECVLDLYCGVGFFTIPLSCRFDVAIGVESNPWAIRLAEHNAQQNGVSHINFVMAQVEKWLESQRGLSGRVDLIVVDPPRPGLTRKIIKSVARIYPERITYVSCNPTTLARDLKHLLAAGYEIKSLMAIDLFPQTYHIETVAKLQRH